MRTLRRAAPALLLLAAAPATAQQEDEGTVTLERLYATADFQVELFGPARWLDGGEAYTTLERAADGRGLDIVRYDAASGARSVLVPAARLVPPGADAPLAIQGYEWSPDGRRLLLFTNSRRVWRTNTRGDYWVLDLHTRELRQLGGDAPEASLMFAKFDPTGERVAYVRGNDLYVEALAGGGIVRLTTDGSRTIINGTFDWAYEEEFQIQDGFRWSPDGERIAYWQLDAEGVRDFLLINNTDSIYSHTIPVQFPKVGTTNSAARVGVVPAAGGETVWFDVPGDPRENYIPRMEWAGRSDAIVIQRMNRPQNENRVLLGDARTGAMRTLFVETDAAYLETVNDWRWIEGGERLLWVSDRDGWRHLYAVDRGTGEATPVTSGEWEIASLLEIDAEGGWVYFLAAPGEPTRRFLYRARLDGRGEPERLTPEDQPGTHGYTIAPGARWALHTWSSFGEPPVTELVSLPDHRVVRTLVDNARLRGVVEALDRGPAEFVRIDIGDIELDAWIMLPPDFDHRKRYPLLFYAYTEPWSQTVVDRWDGDTWLWHLMLTQQGYVVASVDNRGTPAPRGRDFRKALHAKIGQLNIADQAAAARAILAGRPYLDPERVGVWGWSGGGEAALNLIFQHPELYGTAISIAAVTHQKYYDTIYTERYMGLISENEEAYRLGAPLTWAHQLEGNLLIVHGTGDDNVHYQNLEALANELIRHGRQFTMMAYPNRSHGIFEGPGTRRHLFTLMTDYLAEHLMGASAAEMEAPAATR